METLEGGFTARGASAEDAIAGLSISHEIDKQTLADPQAGANAKGGSHAQSSHRFTLSSRHSRSPGFRRVCRRPARIGAGPNRCATARDLPQAIAGAFSTKRSGRRVRRGRALGASARSRRGVFAPRVTIPHAYVSGLPAVKGEAKGRCPSLPASKIDTAVAPPLRSVRPHQDRIDFACPLPSPVSPTGRVAAAAATQPHEKGDQP